MSLELLAGILVWGGVGWLVDHWLGTWPWLFAVGVFLGFGAGLYLVWLRTGEPHCGHSDTDHRDASTVVEPRSRSG